MTGTVLTLAEGMMPTLLMVAGVVLVIIVVMINMRQRQSHRNSEHLAPREKIERAKQTHAMRGDLRQMMVELEDLTRRFSAQLDAKSRRIETLIDQADQTIARLEQLNGQNTASPSEPESKPEPQPDPVEVDPLARQIYQLADSGENSIQIAKKLDEQVGKVELILALRQ